LGVDPFQSFAVIDAQDEDPLALVRCADFTRREYSPRNLVTKAFQFANDISESKANVSFDVLKEADSGTHGNNSGCDKWPEMSWIFCPESFPCCTEWLAGITSREDVHAVTKL